MKKLAGLPAKFHSTGIRRSPQSPTGIGGALIRPPHDDDEDVIIPRHNYFGAARFYCVETITAPCGVVIAWVKFERSESPTHFSHPLTTDY
jgi:hypothetical protein